MARYKVQYADRQGREKYAYVEAQNVESVHAQLAAQGAVDCRVLMEDMASTRGRLLRLEGRLKPEALDAMVRRKLLRQIPWLLLAMALDGCNYWRTAYGPRTLVDWVPVWTLVMGGTMAFALWPAVAWSAIERATVWHRWQQVLRLLPWLEWNPLVFAKVMRSLLGMRRGRALAGLGKEEEGLAVFDAAAAKGGFSRPASDSMRSDILIGVHRYDEAIALRRAAAASDPIHAYDAAITMLRYGGDLAEARALIQSREGAALTEMERIFAEYAHGLLALSDQRFREALDRLTTARKLAETGLVQAPAQSAGLQRLLDGHRALAIASLGEPDWAELVLNEVSEFLLATDEEALVSDCRNAISRARTGSK